jgi:hypothetical protein
MDPGTERIAKKVVDALRSGPLVRFSCVPGAAYPGERVRLTATFYLPLGAVASKLKPLVRALEAPRLEIPLQALSSSSPSSVTFQGEFELPSAVIPAQGVLTLALRPAADTKPLATAKLHVLSRDEIDQLKALTP